MQIRPKNDWWRTLMVIFACTMAVGLIGCSDDTKGEGEEDTCTGFGCGDFFRDMGGDTAEDMTIDTQNEVSDMPTECENGQSECLDTSTLRLCVNGQWDEQTCIDPEVCDSENGQCSAPICPVPGLAYACENENQERVCGPDQLSYEVRDCLSGDTCTSTGCNSSVCSPGDTRCAGADVVEVCNQEGTGWEMQETCGETQLCSLGDCTELCELNEKTASFLGCEYYVVDLDNSSSGTPATDDRPFGITVSNPDPNITASVQVVGGGMTVNETVPPGELRLINLPVDTDVDTSGVFTNNTFYLTSSIPVTVHQFNPLNGDGVFSNDASLLLPTNALGTEYIALANPVTSLRDPTDDLYGESCNPQDILACFLSSFTCGSNGYCVEPCNTDADCKTIDASLSCGSSGTCETGGPPAYVDVVATQPNTVVTVTSPVTIPASGNFPGVVANAPTNFTLNNAGDILHLLSSATVGSDLSGLQITVADDTKPVSVFGGNVCTFVPDKTAYCDHLEQQLFPVQAWSNSYVAAKSSVRGTEPDVWRIVAAQNNTEVTLTPPQNGNSSIMLQAGEVAEIITAESFEISTVDATHKILVGQFWTGSNYDGIDFTCNVTNFFPSESCSTDNDCVAACGGDFGCELAAFCDSGTCKTGSGIGDPAYSLSVPVAQYRSDYIVLTPTGYQENYMTVIAPTGRAPIMDGARINEAPINATPTALNGNWDLYRFPVSEGVHKFQDNAAFGVVAYGYNCDVSYAYPGGLNLEIIN